MPVLRLCKKLARCVEWIEKTDAVPGVTNGQLGGAVHSKAMVATKQLRNSGQHL